MVNVGNWTQTEDIKYIIATALFYLRHHALYLFSQLVLGHVLDPEQKLQNYPEFADKRMGLFLERSDFFESSNSRSVVQVLEFIKLTKGLGLKKESIENDVGLGKENIENTAGLKKTKNVKDQNDHLLDLFNFLYDIKDKSIYAYLEKIFVNNDHQFVRKLLDFVLKNSEELSKLLNGLSVLSNQDLHYLSLNREAVSNVFKIKEPFEKDEELMKIIIYGIHKYSKRIFKNVGTSLSKLNEFLSLFPKCYKEKETLEVWLNKEKYEDSKKDAIKKIINENKSIDEYKIY
jgi:DNA-binding phage protein